MKMPSSYSTPLSYTRLLVAILALLSWWACEPPPPAAAPTGDEIKSVVGVHRVEGAALKPGDRIAIMQFSGGKGRVLADLLAISLLRRGVDVVDRDSLSRVVAEVRRTESGLYDNDLSEAQIIAQIGKIVGADYVLVGETDAKDPPGDIQTPGALGPKFAFARSRLTMRLFSATDGAVGWLGTSESYVRSLEANDVFLLDYLRVTAERAAEALVNHAIASDVQFAQGPAVRTTFPKFQGQAVAIPERTDQPAPPPVEAPPDGPPAPSIGGCTSDAQCKGARKCVNGACTR
ncbi:MAG: hypothetical protein JRI68_27195 [Deltaproteobacteria bacterium]|nr:hypothetical protein [Deltaproteobacteria bacterium]